MKRIHRIVLISVLAGIAGLAGYVTKIYGDIQETANAIYEPLPPNRPSNQASASAGDVRAVVEDIRQTEQVVPFTILLFGVDKRGEDQGRSDTILLLCVSPEQKKTLMLSIPRDTQTEIAVLGKKDKINHAYSAGGVPATVQAVENLLTVPIDYYVKVDMEGFAQIIDSLGGVYVENAFAFQYEGVDFPKGPLQLDGEKALLYSRMRYDDPEGDFGRNKRQQQIVRALMDKAQQVNNVRKLDRLLSDISGSFKTNLTFHDMQNLLFHYPDDIRNVEVERIQGEGQMQNGVYYYVVSGKERQRLSKLIADYRGEGKKANDNQTTSAASSGNDVSTQAVP